jgi:hypothetical protein
LPKPQNYFRKLWEGSCSQDAIISRPEQILFTSVRFPMAFNLPDEILIHHLGQSESNPLLSAQSLLTPTMCVIAVSASLRQRSGKKRKS